MSDQPVAAASPVKAEAQPILRGKSDEDGSDSLETAAAVSAVFVDWTGSTSLHGVAHLSAPSCCRRLLWLLLFLASLSAFLAILGMLIAKYRGYPVNWVHEESVVSSLPFPAVTLCPLNPVSRYLSARNPKVLSLLGVLTKTVEEDADELRQSRQRPGRRGYGGYAARRLRPRVRCRLGQTSAAEYAWMKVAPNRPKWSQTVRDTVQMALSGLADADQASVMPGLGGLMADCQFNGRQCTPDNFTTVVSPEFGRCYAFNFGGSERVRSAGPDSGLFISLFANQSDYVAGLANAAGFRLVLHRPGELPLPGSEGFDLAPGLLTRVGFATRIQRLMSPPYGPCRRVSAAENSDTNLFSAMVVDPATNVSMVKYTKATCQLSCTQRLALQHPACRCFIPRYYAPERIRLASPACEIRRGRESPCLKPEFAAAAAAACDAACPDQCSRVRYRATISASGWPTAVTANRLLRRLATRHLVPAKQIEHLTADQRRHFIQQNALAASVYAEELRVRVNRQESAYGLPDLLSDIGGQGGLWLGVSFLTLCELLEMLSRLCRLCCCGFWTR